MASICGAASQRTKATVTVAVYKKMLKKFLFDSVISFMATVHFIHFSYICYFTLFHSRTV